MNLWLYLQTEGPSLAVSGSINLQIVAISVEKVSTHLLQLLGIKINPVGGSSLSSFSPSSSSYAIGGKCLVSVHSYGSTTTLSIKKS